MIRDWSAPFRARTTHYWIHKAASFTCNDQMQKKTSPPTRTRTRKLTKPTATNHHPTLTRKCWPLATAKAGKSWPKSVLLARKRCSRVGFGAVKATKWWSKQGDPGCCQMGWGPMAHPFSAWLFVPSTTG